MFAELLDTPGVVETVELRSPVGLMAFHGGNLERMTDLIAARAARGAGASLYTVSQPPDLRWHLPSTLIGRERSAGLDRFLGHVDVVISIHGFGRAGYWTSVLLGGRNRDLADHLSAHLAPALPDYEIVSDLDQVPAPLRGQHRHNPVNLPEETGVQVELPPRIRGMGPKWSDSPPGKPVPPTVALIDALIGAVRSWR